MEFTKEELETIEKVFLQIYEINQDNIAGGILYKIKNRKNETNN